MKFAGMGIAVAVFAVLASAFSPPEPSQADKIARGKYLVEGVVLCGDCHTPHDEKGEAIEGRAFRGAPLTFKPITPVPGFADKAPNIAGLRGWEDEAAVKFLMTGIAYNDLPARPPMPQYRLNRDDAEAVVAYLKSLKPSDN